MTRSRRALRVGATLLALALFTGVVAYERVDRQLRIGRACDALAAGRVDEALALSEGLAGADADGRAAAECRCRALRAAGRADACTALLDGILRDPGAGDWVPAPDLAATVVRARAGAGDDEAAARLARRAAQAHPEDAALAQLEIRTRSQREGEQAVLEDMARRLAAGEGPQLGLRMALAVSHSRRHDHEAVLAALGDAPPPRGHPFVPLWYQARAWAHAGLGDLDGLRATYAAWKAHGGDPYAIQADYALQLSIAQLRDPERGWTELLRGALEHESRIRDPEVVAALYLRLIAHHLAAGRHEEALALYDRATPEHTLPGITREQIVQGRMVAEAAPGEAAAARGALVFRAPAAGTLAVSPDTGAPPDAPFETFPTAAGEPLPVERGTAVTPQRWVWRDAEGRVRASGSAWPVAGEHLPIAIEPSPPAAAPRRFRPAPGPADGRRRVFVVIPDCGDWRLVQYLRARGELPVHDALFARGWRAVLESDPPLTAAAMEKLVWPDRGHNVTFLGVVNRLGLELGGLASVGRNPLGFLEAALPEGRSLFEVVGEGPRVAANLLFAHGAIDAGRHAELVGPHGGRRRSDAVRAWRELTPAEAREWSHLEQGAARALRHAETLAAEMDAAIGIARAGEVDLLMLRLEPLDLLTHELFGGLVGTHQDDGASGLLDAYRYLDRRLGGLWNALDADDVLVVMSDHGIRTAMEHSTDAVFVAVGGGVPAGRAPARPELAGVPRALAALLGLETAWPATGVAGWAEAPDGPALARAFRAPPGVGAR